MGRGFTRITASLPLAFAAFACGARDTDPAMPDAAALTCRVDTDCAGDTPRCDRAHARCVACTSGAQCPAGLCDGHGRCAPCHTDGDCAHVCETASGRCVDCRSGFDCGIGHDCAYGVCVPGCDPGGSCVGCIVDADCGPFRRCDPASHACSGCAVDADCPSGDRCDPATARCEPCLPDDDTCPLGAWCAYSTHGNQCVPGCKRDSDCPLVGAFCDGSHACVRACHTDVDCAPGALCHAPRCVPGCTPAHPCPTGLACCGATCIDARSDGDNCGACGNQCQGGFNCCNGACSNPSSDPLNCDHCGHVCDAFGVVGPCVDRTCPHSCGPGYADCDADPMNGCEVHTDEDPANCGGCGYACSLPHARSVCRAGACAVDTCDPGFLDCDHVAAGGCETIATTCP